MLFLTLFLTRFPQSRLYENVYSQGRGTDISIRLGARNILGCELLTRMLLANLGNALFFFFDDFSAWKDQ
jgi:hypothetical protein